VAALVMWDETATFVLAEGRALAESLMVDTLTINGKSTRNAINADGERIPVPGPVRYSGKGKIQARDVQERNAGGGAHDYVSIRQEIHIPVTAKDPEGEPAKIVAGDVVKMLDCPLDPSNVGRVFRVAAPQGKSLATAQRLQVDEIVG
jgi:hypothetical protein